jgi:SAM-dependent methyltransferase
VIWKHGRNDATGPLSKLDLLQFADGKDPWASNYITAGFGGNVPRFREAVRRWQFDGLGRIADIGSGFGRWSVFLAEVNERVDGFDRNDEGVALSRRLATFFHLQNQEYHSANIAVLPADSASFDGVWCANTLHVVDRAKTLREANRILRVGGRLVALNFNGLGAVSQKFIIGYQRGGLNGHVTQWALRCIARGPRYSGEPNYGDVDLLAETLGEFGFSLEGDPLIFPPKVTPTDIDHKELADRLKTDDAFCSTLVNDPNFARSFAINISFSAVKIGDPDI